MVIDVGKLEVLSEVAESSGPAFEVFCFIIFFNVVILIFGFLPSRKRNAFVLSHSVLPFPLPSHLLIPLDLATVSVVVTINHHHYTSFSIAECCESNIFLFFPQVSTPAAAAAAPRVWPGRLVTQ